MIKAKSFDECESWSDLWGAFNESILSNKFSTDVNSFSKTQKRHCLYMRTSYIVKRDRKLTYLVSRVGEEESKKILSEILCGEGVDTLATG